MSTRSVVIFLTCLLCFASTPVLAADTGTAPAQDIVESSDTAKTGAQADTVSSDTTPSADVKPDTVPKTGASQPGATKEEEPRSTAASSNGEGDQVKAVANEAPPKEEKKPKLDPDSIEGKIDGFFGEYIVGPLATVLLWKIPGLEMPLIVFWLLFGAVVFTVFMRFVNFRMFKHGIDLVRGKYDDPDNPGEVSHFQALTTALSATVGLGNIAGVAIAYMLGGAGATFWMIVVGLFGMASKFAEVTLGQQYREVRPDGRIMGGAMYYLSNGLREIGKPKLGKFLAVFFVLLCVGASFGGGNAFQVYQSLGQIKTNVPLFAESPRIYGLIMTVLAGIVIIGGIKRIANIADKIVPAMCVVYVLVCLYIIFTHAGEIGGAFGAIFSGAFSPDAAFGGVIGVLVVGIQRAVFSNEAGLGSAAIAHSAAKVKHPVEEGFVALLEPFIDTVVICTMTALVLIITDASSLENFEVMKGAKDGATLTSMAMGGVVGWFPYVLSVAVFLFAFSTMIAWSYYGERCWVWLFGDQASMSYRVVFLVFTFLGSVLTGTNVLDFSDLMILGMAFPNLIGVILLSKKVRGAMEEYQGKLKSGEIKPTS